jgi:hypothetical protein
LRGETANFRVQPFFLALMFRLERRHLQVLALPPLIIQTGWQGIESRTFPFADQVRMDAMLGG